MLLIRSAKYGSDRKVSFTLENVTYMVSKVRVRSQRKFRQKKRHSSSEQSPQAFAKKHGPQKNKKQKKRYLQGERSPRAFDKKLRDVTYMVSKVWERSQRTVASN